MNRVVITRKMVGICHMQVCVEKDCSDEEILEVCNSENPAGTSAGWCEVIRKGKNKPAKCDDDDNRLHLLVAC